jgi:hypothetical protein
VPYGDRLPGQDAGGAEKRGSPRCFRITAPQWSGTGGQAAFGGEAGFDPVLDSVGVLADVGVAELLESAGDLAAVGAGGVGAVGDQGGVLVGQQSGCLGVDVVGDEVERAGQVLLGVVGLGERVDEGSECRRRARP